MILYIGTFLNQIKLGAATHQPCNFVSVKVVSNSQSPKTAMARQPRQRPISCKLCRQRKLRCSRVFPCSNCVCRGVECVHDGPNAAPSAAVESQDKPASADLPKDLSASELLSRLERLESMIASQNKDAGPPLRPVQYPDETATAGLATQSIAKESPISPQLQKLTDDALSLERSCSGNYIAVGRFHFC